MELILNSRIYVYQPKPVLHYHSIQTNNACTSDGAAAFRQANSRQIAAAVELLPVLLPSNLTIRERSFRRIWGISN